MNESIPKRWSLFQMFESVLLACCTLFLAWTADKVVTLNRELAVTNALVTINTGRLNKIEEKGSTGLQSHERSDDERIGSMNARADRQDLAIQGLSVMAGDVKGMSIRLDVVREAIARIEKTLDSRPN